MRSYSLTELFHLTRAELLALRVRIAAGLPALPEASAERQVALDNLRRIGCALGRRAPAP